jgi:serine/threonine protein kinase
LNYLHDCNYIHFDIKPSNFFISENSLVKLGDFNLTKKKSFLNDEYLEGDSSYLAPEILEVKIKDLNEKCDVYSLGLTFLEILFKIELPTNGVLWQGIRNPNFTIPKEFSINTNIEGEIPKEFLDLINGMISSNPKERFDLKFIIDNFYEIKIRKEKLFQNTFIPRYFGFVHLNEEKLDISNLKRSSKKVYL